MLNTPSKKRFPVSIRLAILGVATLGAACATAPNRDLQMARDAFQRAQGDPLVVNNAPVALHEAQQSLDQADKAKDQAEVSHLAYMAQRRVELARADAQTKLSEAAEKQQFKDREAQRVQSLQDDKARQNVKLKSLEDELAALKAEKTERGYVITLGDVLFDYNQASLKAGAQQNLYALVTFLTDYPDQIVTIEGHTDSRGSASYNLELSEFRAQSVEDFLRQNGVAAERISTQGFGMTRPIASNATDAGRQQNRRVELVISEQGRSPTVRSGL